MFAHQVFGVISRGDLAARQIGQLVEPVDDGGLDAGPWPTLRCGQPGHARPSACHDVGGGDGCKAASPSSCRSAEATVRALINDSPADGTVPPSS